MTARRTAAANPKVDSGADPAARAECITSHIRDVRNESDSSRAGNDRNADNAGPHDVEAV